jgi:hypothetical protein
MAMNIPTSARTVLRVTRAALHPFGYIGRPRLHQTPHDKTASLIAKTTRHWYAHINKDVLFRTDETAMLTNDSIEKHAIVLGATYSRFKRNLQEGGHILFFVIGDIQYRVMLK